MVGALTDELRGLLRCFSAALPPMFARRRGNVTTADGPSSGSPVLDCSCPAEHRVEEVVHDG
jgi:hypothetical protein